ncbi:MAG: hypothetical protein H8F28_07200 [Fibrella sp.]|nr:hypothetical protein [Armatimonadota bacterium]
MDDLPWDRTRERTLGDLVVACATDPLHSDAPKRLEQAVANGHLGQKAAWHVLGLAVGGFTTDLVVAYLGGPKPSRLTDLKRLDMPPASGSEIPDTVAHAYLPDAETDPDNPVSRVAMTLRLEDELDWKACRAEVSRVIDWGDAASESEIDLAIRLAAAMEDFERRDTHVAGGQTAMPMPGPRPDTDRELLERAIERAPVVTEEQKRRLRLLADGTDPDAGVTE